MDGVTEDGVRTVPLSSIGTIELIQFVGQEQVANGVGGFRFMICLRPSQTEPESFVENWCWSLV